MLAVIDIGNTNIVFAFVDNGKWIHTFRIFTDNKKTSDEYFVIFSSLIEKSEIDIKKIERVVISSVVPFLTRSIEKNAYALFGKVPLVISKDVNTGLVKESIPSELGSDLLCNAAYAHFSHPDKNVMVVDFGTALTFTTVNRNGEILGVAIAPGLITAVNSLFGSTAQLPQVELKIPKTSLGRDSQQSIRSGIMFGWAGMVESMIIRTEQETESKLYVIATGGLSKTISPLIGRIDHVDPLHTLKGLGLIANLN